ncbi:MAG: sigma-70 family RNA polymerase sigma factor [Verrucomicrobia bacterium]|nr:sigma-70 family RNA polymerase sigma factor [Verrucomicrobiota bacterium]
MSLFRAPASPAVDDAGLVSSTLAGDRDAYGQIVRRYQSLICAITYSGTGNLAQSRDLAQETFVTGWRRLRELRDPASVRAWLCGIARNLVSHSHRQAAREPAAIGESLDPTHPLATGENSPSDETIRQEEEALLWRALGGLPETYREPLVLYYREHHSIAQVARALDLSEDAVKQRLSRGRTLLQERMVAFIEGTLEKTRPGNAFTGAVLSALPVLAPGLAATGGVSAAKGTSAAKAGGGGLGGLLWGGLVLFGGLIGWQMRPTAAQSEVERRWAGHFWRCLLLMTAAVILPSLALLLLVGRQASWVPTALSYYLIGGYVLLAVPFGIWAWENHLRVRGKAGAPRSPRRLVGLFTMAAALAALGIGGARSIGFPNGSLTDLWLQIVFALAVMFLAIAGWELHQRRNRDAVPTGTSQLRPLPVVWVTVTTGVMVLFLLPTLFSGGRREVISPEAARQLLAAHPEARVVVQEYETGQRHLAITVRTGNHETRYFSRLEPTSLAWLAANGKRYETLRQGQDFERLGSAGRSLLLLAVVTTVAGMVLIVHAWWNRRRASFPSSLPIPSGKTDSAA